MHPMLRLLLKNAGTRKIAAAALKRLRCNSRTHKAQALARDRAELAKRLELTPNTARLAKALEQQLEEEHDALVSVNLDRRGVTLTPRGASGPAHRFIYPLHPHRLVYSARKLHEDSNPPEASQ